MIVRHLRRDTAVHPCILYGFTMFMTNISTHSLLANHSSPTSLSPRHLGRSAVELELHPSGHQANQLGRPAQGLQPAPGKSNTGLPFPPGTEIECV